MSLDTLTFFTKLGEYQLGKPFTWAQNICGLNFIISSKSMKNLSNNESTQETVPAIVDKMHARLKARYQLYRQLLVLEKKFYGNGSKSSSSSNTQSCILAQWSPITFAEYEERTITTGRFIDENLVTTNHLLYHTVLIRGSAKMECFVSVSPNYPNECPIWAITLNLNGSRLHPSNSNDIKVHTVDRLIFILSIHVNSGTKLKCMNIHNFSLYTTINFKLWPQFCGLAVQYNSFEY